MTNTQTKDLFDRYEVNKAKIAEIAENCERENRTRNESEDAQYNRILREQSMLEMKMQAAKGGNAVQEVNHDQMLRERLFAGKEVTISLKREIQTSAAVADAGIIAVDIKDMLTPIREGLIYDKVGINVAYGLNGTLRWPKHTQAKAHFADEAERLVDGSIDFGKLEMTGSRLGVAIPVTREEIEETDGIVERVIREEMPQAIVDLINDTLFSPEATYKVVNGGNTTTKNKRIVGPFVAASANAYEFAGAVPTRKELLELKSQVTGSGIKLVAPCWVMTETMKAELEDTKVDAGSGRFVCEDNKIFGYPVFTTPSIGEGNIGFGDWSYQAAGFFGDMNLVVDPYTLARNNATDFVLNARFGTVTLRPEAFAFGTVNETD